MKLNKIYIKIFHTFPLLFAGLIFLTQKFYLSELILSFLPILLIIYFIYISVNSLFLLLSKDHIKSIIILLNILLFCLLATNVLDFYSKDEPYFKERSDDDIKMLSINIYYNNVKYEDIINVINQKNPDILYLIEYSPNHLENLDTKLSKSYEYSTGGNSLFGSNIVYSKHPIKETNTINLSNGQPGFIKSKININGRMHNFYTIHTAAPINNNYYNLRNTYLSELYKFVKESNEEKVILGGDFNISPWSYYFRDFETKLSNFYSPNLKYPYFTWRILNLDLVSSHIDHYFVSEDINTTHFEIVEFEGTDHKGIYLEFAK